METKPESLPILGDPRNIGGGFHQMGVGPLKSTDLLFLLPQRSEMDDSSHMYIGQIWCFDIL